jgi:hypothetical protein
METSNLDAINSTEVKPLHNDPWAQGSDGIGAL